MSDSPAIDVQNLRKTYRDGWFNRRQVPALQGVSFQVRRGEIFGLLGPNGAGKTTLIKVLLGIVRRSQGEASLLGRPAGDRAGRRLVGYLPESHRIPGHHTANSALAYYGALSNMSRREIRERRPGLLELVGLEKWGNTNVRKYSKGMLQRLGLAQALMHNPELLVLDEPTDGVDPVGRSEMRTLMQKLKSEGKTIFINSHLLQELELVCDRVAILDHGQVLREGPLESLTLRSQTEVRLSLSGDEAPIRAALEPWSVTEFQPNGNSQNGGAPNGPTQFNATVLAADQTAVDALIDTLRRRGVSVVSLAPARQTLEQAFLEIIREARRSA